MPASKEKNGTWRARFYYTDYTGRRRETQKRGFPTKKDALEYEREFLQKSEFNIEMSFKSLCELYFQDLSTRIKESTFHVKKNIIETKLIPYFCHFKICDITPNIIRIWQGKVLQDINPKTKKKYSQTYIKSLNTHLTAIFNYAVNYHNLKENPCKKAGSIGKANANEMNIWTFDEFKIFINSKSCNDLMAKTGFNILFWTGMRIGELLALTKEDIDFENKTIRINKTYLRLKNKDIITPPKTPKSNRIIDIDDNLLLLIKEYINKLYDLKDNDRLFPVTKFFFNYRLKTGIKKTNLKEIRIHDLRHSHASLLIHLGVNIVLISKRLGHEKVQTTLNIYSHIYPEANFGMIDKLSSISKDINNVKK